MLIFFVEKIERSFYTLYAFMEKYGKVSLISLLPHLINALYNIQNRLNQNSVIMISNCTKARLYLEATASLYPSECNLFKIPGTSL